MHRGVYTKDEKSGSIQQFNVQQPATGTAKGLKAIEDGSLTWLDDEMCNNLNTGVLEQYLEEKNLEESFEVSHWSPSKVMIGIAIGAIFSGVTAYIGLKLGLAISAWYIAYLLGMALKWSPSRSTLLRRQRRSYLLRLDSFPPSPSSCWHRKRSIR